MPEPVAVALDVGGMSIRSGVVHRDAVVDRVARFPVDNRAPADELLAVLAAAIDEPLAGLGRLPVAVAFPAPFDYEAGIPLLEHKWGSIHGVVLADELAARCSQPFGALRVVNDAEAAAIGQALRSGDTSTPTLVITLGTGLGAALVDGGRVVPERDGITPGDLWQHRLDSGESADAVFSATGLARRVGVPPAELPALLGNRPVDPRIAAWAAELGAFVEMIADRLHAERVIVGGGVAEAFDAFGPALAAATTRRVVPAVDQVGAALLGAAALADPELGPST